MSTYNFFIAGSLKIFFIAVIAFSISSCGKETSDQSGKNRSGSELTNKGGNTTDTSENFIVKYEMTGKRTGKMQITRSEGKFKEVMDFQSNGTYSLSEFYLLNDTVFTAIRVDGRKVGSRTGYKNFKESYTANELLYDVGEFSKFLEKAKLNGSEKILGYDCDIYELSDGTLISIYNKRYPLRIVKSTYTATATSLLINTMISQNEFVLPADLEYHDKDKKIIKFGTKEDSIAYYNKK